VPDPGGEGSRNELAYTRFEAKDYDDRTCIVVVDTMAESGPVMTGVVVDSVAGVLNIAADELQLFTEAAKHVLALTEKQLAALVRTGDFVEVKADEQKVS
jgi:chemotaxis signal transduction protein